MRLRNIALTLSLLAFACGKKEEGHDHDDGHDHEHAATGPHGGEILEIGGGAYHLEILHDHDGGKMTVWVLDGALKETLSVPAPTVNLVTAAGPVQFRLEAAADAKEGAATSWKGAHDGLKADPWNGRIVIEIGGKQYQSPLEGEAHRH